MSAAWLTGDCGETPKRSGRWAAPLGVLALLLLCSLSSPAGADDGTAVRWLQERLSALAADQRLAGAKVGVVVLEPASATPLVNINGEAQFNVASNVKIITTAAALSLLGPEYRLKTVVHGGPLQGETLAGDLYLKGYGDPSLEEEDLWELANDLYDRGLRRVQGQLVIDESYFDDQHSAPLFDERTTDMWYRSPNGSLSLNQNAVAVRVLGGDTPGAPARVILSPSSSYLQLDNKAVTFVRGRRSWVKVQTIAKGQRTIVQVRGRVKLGYRSRLHRRRIEHPGLLTGKTFLDKLRQLGISFARPQLGQGQVPDSAPALGYVFSDPLALIVRQTNKRSDNFMAEQLVKVLGAEVYGQPGSWPKGLKALERYLAAQRIAQGSYTIRNGSGLYDATRLSPLQLAQVIRQAAGDFKIGPEFLASLALGGVDGTMKHRLRGSGAERYVRAKTGTLADVVALSGVVGASAGGRSLVFSICCNALAPEQIAAARAVTDEMAAAMVTYLER